MHDKWSGGKCFSFLEDESFKPVSGQHSLYIAPTENEVFWFSKISERDLKEIHLKIVDSALKLFESSTLYRIFTRTIASECEIRI